MSCSFFPFLFCSVCVTLIFIISATSSSIYHLCDSKGKTPWVQARPQSRFVEAQGFLTYRDSGSSPIRLTLFSRRGGRPWLHVSHCRINGPAAVCWSSGTWLWSTLTGLPQSSDTEFYNRSSYARVILHASPSPNLHRSEHPFYSSYWSICWPIQRKHGVLIKSSSLESYITIMLAPLMPISLVCLV